MLPSVIIPRLDSENSTNLIAIYVQLLTNYGGLSEIVYPPRSWSASSIWATIVYQVPDNECLPRGRVTGSEELKPPNRHGQKHKMKTAQHCPQKHLAHQQWSPYAVNESDPRFETKPTINWHTVFPCLAKTSKAKGGRVAQDMNSSLAASSASLPAVDISNVKKCSIHWGSPRIAAKRTSALDSKRRVKTLS
ncbi:hypothetical protein T02_7702 [Trichinella nativa]|uniref:Uncharacterized protein n=1 Tax=Trichinella nativa TaxID=6335 RepID=A0A0V1KUN7_9BILA|nr:hypothetical protein T02_7702 [Trichinella nativa]